MGLRVRVVSGRDSLTSCHTTAGRGGGDKYRQRQVNWMRRHEPRLGGPPPTPGLGPFSYRLIVSPHQETSNCSGGGALLSCSSPAPAPAAPSQPQLPNFGSWRISAGFAPRPPQQRCATNERQREREVGWGAHRAPT